MKPIKPLKTEKDYEAALKEIDQSIDSPPGTLAHDRLEVLSVLVEAYEEWHHPIYTEDIEPIEVIKFWLDQNGLSRKDLEPFLGSRAKVSEVFSGKRPLSITMIRRLMSAGIPADLLIRPIPMQRAA
jgi:HTH-type transcriptional regulator/antitoxin HigA